MEKNVGYYVWESGTIKRKNYLDCGHEVFVII